MKKLLALGLSLAMMASLSAVAFAAENPTIIDKDSDPQSADIVVRTTFDDVDNPGEPSENEKWTVTIPADVNVPWNNEADSTVDGITYSIDAVLLPDSSVTVEVAPFGEDALTLVNGEAELKATIAGDASKVQTGTGYTEGTLSATITKEAFNNASVGNYAGTLTFDVTYANRLG